MNAGFYCAGPMKWIRQALERDRKVISSLPGSSDNPLRIAYLQESQEAIDLAARLDALLHGMSRDTVLPEPREMPEVGW